MQSLVRSMPGLHKTLILAYPHLKEDGSWEVQELAMATEHAPFRHKKAVKEVGGQRKRNREEEASDDIPAENDLETE